MTTHAFRFGVVAGTAGSGDEWRAAAARLASLGFDSVLIPDTQFTLSPPLAALAASQADSALVAGPYVLSAPNRTPGQVAVETATLHTLTGGRYQLGIGAGRPQGAEADAAAFGMPFGTAGERLRQVADTVAAVRDRTPDVRVLVAAGGPKALQQAGAIADIVAFGVAPQAGGDVLAAAVETVRTAAGNRADDLELSLNLFAVGGVMPAFGSSAGLKLDDLRAAGSPSVLDGDSPEELADGLRALRDTFGISYVCTSLDVADALAPAAGLLAGT